MGKPKQTEDPTTTDEVTTQVTTTEQVNPSRRKYRYVGPAYPKLNFPALRIAFRPATITDAEIDRLLKRAPQLERYFKFDS